MRDRVRGLMASGANVDVIAAGDGHDLRHEFPEPGVRVLRLPSGPLPVGAPSLFYSAGAPEMLDGGVGCAWLQALAFFARACRAIADRVPAWDRIESHWLVPSALAVGAAGRCVPHRAFAHGGDVAMLERVTGGGAMAQALVRSGARLTFVSEDLRARFARLGGALVGNIEPAPVDAAHFVRADPATRAQARRALGISRSTVLGVGRLVSIKGFDLLVRAAARLSPGRPPDLVLAGEGPERLPLSRLATARGVRLRLLGSLSRQSVAQWLAAADVLVQPSRILPNGRAEGMPLAVREALARGTPVVATACGGLTELSGRPDLVLVSPEDPAALAAAIAPFVV